MYFYTYTYDSTIIKNANRAFKNYKHYDVQDHYDAYSKTITLKYNSKQNAFYQYLNDYEIRLNIEEERAYIQYKPKDASIKPFFSHSKYKKIKKMIERAGTNIS